MSMEDNFCHSPPKKGTSWVGLFVKQILYHILPLQCWKVNPTGNPFSMIGIGYLIMIMILSRYGKETHQQKYFSRVQPHNLRNFLM